MMEFGKRITTTPNADGTITIKEEGFYNGLNSVKEETREDVIVTRETVLRELIQSLDLLKTTHSEINIRIVKDKYGEPQLLQKTWVVIREKIK